MIQEETEGVVFFQDPDFDPRGITVHGFFGRCGGVSAPPFDSLNIGWNCGDAPEAVKVNLVRVASALGIPASAIFRARQVHGTRVATVQAFPSRERLPPPADWPEADALLTDNPAVALAVSTADCLPVFLLDPARPAIGAVHAGWRGSVNRIAVETVRRMNLAFGTIPASLRVLMGPSIGPCCYRVGTEVARLASAAAPGVESFLRACPEGGWTLDLRRLNVCQVLSCGVPEENIRHVELCTACRPDLFFSVRRDRDPTGRQIAIIGLAPDSGRLTRLKKTHRIADSTIAARHRPGA